MGCRVLPNPNARRSSLLLAPRFADIESAVAAMNEGIVVNDDGRIVAFHERHLPMIERGYGNWKV